MPLLPTPGRRNNPELMDSAGLPLEEVEEAYRVLRRVNRQFFGSLRSLRAEVVRFLSEDGRPGAVSLLDVGSGSGDIPHAAREILASRGCMATSIVLDLDPTALSLAVPLGLPRVRGDALRLPFPD